jgi:hypothetical protein
MDPTAPGRGAITGRGGTAVWDFLSLSDRPKTAPFTSYPHLTLAVQTDHLEVAITIPNGVVAPVRKRLARLGEEGLVALNSEILGRAKGILEAGGWIEAYAVQRHFPSQRSSAVTDARVTFNLETSRPRGTRLVKRQPEWVRLFAGLLGTKRSNIQFGFVAHLPWTAKGLDSRASLGLIVEGWSSMKPLLDRVRGERPELR